MIQSFKVNHWKGNNHVGSREITIRLSRCFYLVLLCLLLQVDFCVADFYYYQISTIWLITPRISRGVHSIRQWHVVDPFTVPSSNIHTTQFQLHHQIHIQPYFKIQTMQGSSNKIHTLKRNQIRPRAVYATIQYYFLIKTIRDQCHKNLKSLSHQLSIDNCQLSNKLIKKKSFSPFKHACISQVHN